MLGLSNLVCGNYGYQLFSFEYFLDSMSNLEQSKIELWGVGPHLYQDDFTDDMVQSLHSKIQERGIEVICYTPEQCLYPINIASEEPHIRQRSINYLKRSLEIANMMEAEKTLITVGQGYRDKEKEPAWNRCVDALQMLGDYAKNMGSVIAFEHLTADTTNLCIKAEEVKQMLDQVNHPWVKPMVDVDMAARIGEGAKDYIDIFKEDIIHVHFTDGSPGGHVALGDGVLPLESYISDLNNIHYNGYLTLEILSNKYVLDPESGYRKSLRWFKDFLSNA